MNIYQIVGVLSEKSFEVKSLEIEVKDTGKSFKVISGYGYRSLIKKSEIMALTSGIYSNICRCYSSIPELYLCSAKLNSYYFIWGYYRAISFNGYYIT